jgi:uncharacterized protein (DUF2267 family)
MMLGPLEFWGSHAEARMRFVRDIASRAELPPHITAEAAAAAVMCVVTERLTPGGACAMLEALPVPLRSLFERCVEHRTGPISPLDRSALLDRTSEHLGVTPARAEVICRAVLHAVRGQLPPDVSDHLAAQLPGDLKELWYATPPPVHVPTVSETEAEALRVDVLAKVERLGELPPGIDSAAAFMAVMCTFAQRLSGGEARHVLLGLPGTLRPFVTSCMLHRDEPAQPFGSDELLRRVSEHLGTSVTVAEDIVRAVFSAVKTCLPSKDVEDAASQLPPDLRALWLGS